MSRERVSKVSQDAEGNLYRELDDTRAVEGMSGLSTKTGIVNIGSASTSTVEVAYSRPTHSSELYVSEVHAYNSVGSGSNTFTLYDVETNSSGSVTSSTQRSVPIHVGSGATRFNDYSGASFDHSVGVESEFEGQIGVAVISDHHEDDEPAQSV